MPVFQYKALQADGIIAEGELEAGGRQEAFRQLEGRSLRPIKLAERNGKSGTAPSKAPKIPAKDVSSETKAGSSLLTLKLSLGNSNKISARLLENFTRLLSS